MTTPLAYACECGRMLAIHISKEAQYRALGINLAEGRELDEAEATATKEAAAAFASAGGFAQLRPADRCQCGQPIPGEDELLKGMMPRSGKPPVVDLEPSLTKTHAVDGSPPEPDPERQDGAPLPERNEPSMELQADRPTVTFQGGPLDRQVDSVDREPAVIGTGREGGVYQRTEEEADGLAIYRWQPLSAAEVNALVRGDLRANQQPER